MNINIQVDKSLFTSSVTPKTGQVTSQGDPLPIQNQGSAVAPMMSPNR